jgi:hypothetical protein
MDYQPKSQAQIEVTLMLHPRDHDRALAIAKAANLDEHDFFALAIHLGAEEIRRSSATR